MPDDFAGVSFAAGGSGPLRAINSLHEAHVAALAKAWRARPQGWSLERHLGCDGDLQVMLVPEDATQATVVFSRSAAGFHLAVLLGDDYLEVGCFGSIDALVAMACKDERVAGRKNVLF